MAPNLSAAFSPFFSLWDYVPPNLLTYRQRAGITDVRSDRKTSIAWTRVHAIPITSTCLIWSLSNHDRRAHRSPHGITRSMDLHQCEGCAITIGRPPWRPIFFSLWRLMERQISVGRTTTDRTTRSSSDD